MGSAKYPSFGDMGLELVVVVGTLATSLMTAYGPIIVRLAARFSVVHLPVGPRPGTGLTM